ncbi:HD domain-containing protein [Blastococcus jejuensis]|uniref:HD domain-containing protein n=1 Tax=Blastococcus jejuensis TaxID=351224 RepID=A0ABP6NYL6_9ACTN
MVRSPDDEGLRLTEFVAAISLATDLVTGQPMEHALRTCRLSVTVARHLGLDSGTVADVHYVALLRFLGCTADAPDMAHLAGGDNLALMAAFAPVYMGSAGEGLRTLVHAAGRGRSLPRRAGLVAEALAHSRTEVSHCEVGARLAARLGLGAGVVEALAHAYERWDGRGLPGGLSGVEIPVPVRVVVVARDAVLWHRMAGTAAAIDVLSRRRGRAYDPAVVDAVRAVGLPEADDPTAWEDVLAGEPEPVHRLGAVGLDRALAAVGDFADLRSTWTRGRSSRLAATARAAGRACGLPASDVATLTRAALVADVGAVGVPSGVWERRGPLGVEESERVRLHAYLSERVLGRCAGLRPVAALAGAHHERLDGSGYHRGSGAPQLSSAARLLAAGDVWTALREDRPHRRALAAAAARDVLWREAADGRLDRTAVDALLSADGPAAARPRAPRPAGLSDREVEVLRLIARGHSNREVARRLWISAKTVGHHVEHIYAKIGVTTRPAAALFAMEHDLLGEWGDRPMPLR